MVPSSRFPQVALVGAGPGDPGLVTRRGEQWLRSADVVLFDGLCNPEILQLAPQAEHICVGKHGRSRIWSQSEINDEMVAQAGSGRRVVRLKGGDPAVFARTSEEIAALRQAGIRFEVVPGITAALAAGSYAGIPVTHRGLASAVALVTGHEEPSKQESSLDWDALARFPGTLVVYMGVTTVQSWTAALLKHGKPADTPTAILRRCSLPDQQSILCRLDECADHLTPATKIRPPVIVIIGPVAELATDGSWFGDRPLFGRRVLITRPIDQTDELADLLADLGAVTQVQPAVEIKPLPPGSEIDQQLSTALREIEHFDRIIFSSRNGVRFLFQRMLDLGIDARALGGCKLTAVGQRTAQALRQFGLVADDVPDTFSADGVLDSLSDSIRGKSILLPRASRGPDTLPEGLREAGAEVTEVVAYLHEDVKAADPSVAEAMEAGSFAWTTVTSSGIARSLVSMFGESLHQTRLASLSPKTSATLRELGFSPAAESSEASMAQLCQALIDADQAKQEWRG